MRPGNFKWLSAQRIGAILCGILIFLGGPEVRAASDEEIAEAGDIVQLLLPLGGYVGAWITGDKQGAFQLTKVIAASSITAHTIKFSASRVRPDGTDSLSFPSGHTTAAYSGAEFIRIRYGNGWGIPAHIGAAFVGYSRIRANKHFADDVLAGASNGLMWNWYFSSPYSEVLQLQPVVLEDGYAVEFSYNFDGKIRTDSEYNDSPRFKYNFEFGPVTQDKNLFTSPTATGTELDLATAENELDFTSQVSFQHYFAPRHEWEAYLSPLELVEFDPAKLVPGPILFGGEIFVPTPTSTFRTRYNFNELRLVYRYSLVDAERWALKIGGGIQYSDTYLGLRQYEGDSASDNIIAEAEAESIDYNAILSARVEFDFNYKWSLIYELDGTTGSQKFVNTALLLDYRIAPEWNLGFGVRYASWEIENETLKNELEYGDVVFRVAHYFF
jgi:membrane-associated phospholipid phosphatase